MVVNWEENFKESVNIRMRRSNHDSHIAPEKYVYYWMV